MRLSPRAVRVQLHLPGQAVMARAASPPPPWQDRLITLRRARDNESEGWYWEHLISTPVGPFQHPADAIEFARRFPGVVVQVEGR